jgi:transposase
MRKIKKWSKLDNHTIKRLAEAFSLGIPALQAATYAGVHRNTATKFFKDVRMKIAEQSIQKVQKLAGEIELDESYCGGKEKGMRGRGSKNKQIVFGILERKGVVRKIIVEDVSAETLMKEIIKNTKKRMCVLHR